ncbi:DUF397 domain-containing protein [Micromonospora sp. NPDC085948]|uniref:DUF397 domain-containing protein n=1 Tax=Micromonospora sp. NPDC085948 TaxID=3155293 RepID=UPI003440EFFF
MVAASRATSAAPGPAPNTAVSAARQRVRDRRVQVDVRDSKSPDAGMLSFAPAAWDAFVGTIKGNVCRP